SPLRSRNRRPTSSSDRYGWMKIYVLDQVEQPDAFLHRALKRFAAGNQPRAAGALVDHRELRGVGEIVPARFAARIDETGAAHETVDDLVARQVDWMVAGQLGVNQVVGFAELFERAIASVVGGLLLLDDVRFDRDAEVVGLSGEIGAGVVILVPFVS